MENLRMRKLTLIALIVLVNLSIIVSVSAQGLSYPELSVTPLASKRLQMEAKLEAENKFYVPMEMQLSALTTFVAGVMQMGNVDLSSDENERSPYAGLLVGGAWLAINYTLSNLHKPYKRAYKKVSKLPRKNKRARLVRERMAEEEINRIGRLGNKMKWMSFVTNAGAAGYMFASAKEDTSAKLVNVIALAASFAPLFFENRWSRVAKEQRRYKKRIYGPVASTALLSVPGSKHRVAPGMMLSMRF